MVMMRSDSGVQRYSYDRAARRLEVEFPRGAVYHYYDVPPAVFDWLEVVSDKTRYVNRIIARDYRFSCVSDGRPAATVDLEEALRLSLAIAKGRVLS